MANSGGPWGGNNNGGGNPWGNRGSTPGGPDLDEMIRRSQERLKSVLPGGGPKSSLVLIGLIVLALVALQGLSQGHVLGFYRVNDGEIAVVQRFGAAVRQEQPGLRWLIPVAERYTAVSLSNINRIEIGQTTQGGSGLGRSRDDDSQQSQLMMLTGDANMVDMQFTVQWRVNDAQKFLFNMRDPQVTLRMAAESVARDVMGQSEIMVAISSGRDIMRPDIEKRLSDMMKMYDNGIEITQVSLQRLEPPAQVTQAFYDAQQAAETAKAAINQAEGYRSSVLPAARAEANRMMEEARAYKAQVTANAQGDAQRFTKVLEAYRLSEKSTSTRLYLETMEQVLGGANKVILDGPGADRVMPYLPLDQLRRTPGTTTTGSAN